MTNKGKILITGANGFTGRHACAYFEQRGYEVIGVVRIHQQLDIPVDIKTCNLLIKEDVLALIQSVRPDFVLHLAAQNHVGESWVDPAITLEVNVMTSLYLLEAIRQTHLRCRVMLVGSSLQLPSKLEPSPHPYSLSKTLQELIALAWESMFQMDILIVKPSNLIGPGYSTGVCSIFAKKIIAMEQGEEQKILKVTNLRTKRDFLDVRDAVAGYEYVLLLGKTGHIYPITTGKLKSLEDLIQTLKKYTPIPFSVIEQIESETDQSVVIETNPQDVVGLGWRPQIPFEVSVSDTLRFYRLIIDGKEDRN